MENSPKDGGSHEEAAYVLRIKSDGVEAIFSAKNNPTVRKLWFPGSFCEIPGDKILCVFFQNCSKFHARGDGKQTNNVEWPNIVPNIYTNYNNSCAFSSHFLTQ